MKELEYLAKQAKYALIAPSPKQAISAKPETILAIAEALRALQRRAEAAEAKYSEVSDWYAKMKTRMLAAEAKLTELDKQKFVAVLDIQRGRADGNTFAITYTRNGHALADDVYQLFTRPAPAINLVELVPEERPVPPFKTHQAGLSIGFNACRAAILRNIEEAGKK